MQTKRANQLKGCSLKSVQALNYVSNAYNDSKSLDPEISNDYMSRPASKGQIFIAVFDCLKIDNYAVCRLFNTEFDISQYFENEIHHKPSQVQSKLSTLI